MEVLDCWLSLQRTITAPATWSDFEKAFKVLVPVDYECTVMDKLKRCQQKGSAVDYIKELRRLVLVLSDKSEKNKPDKFVDSSRQYLKMEVCRDPSRVRGNCKGCSLNGFSFRCGK